MRVLLAFDKFKGSATAREVCQALQDGIQEADPSARVIQLPLADGGDGSLKVLSQYVSGQWVPVDNIRGPLGVMRTVSYYRSGQTAYVEMATASGIALIQKQELDPMHAHSYGTGQLIRHAIEYGCRQVYLFIGGSSSTDGGTGALEALGVEFLDQNGQLIHSICGARLSAIHQIKYANMATEAHGLDIRVVCDVQNPLYGPEGSAFVYAPQKGATSEQVTQLDAGLRHFAKKIKETTAVDVQAKPGTGAAGGIAGGFLGLLKARIVSGSSLFAELTALHKEIRKADLVLTGEGKVDDQTVQGKIIGDVISLALSLQKPLCIVCGMAENVPESLGSVPLYTVLQFSESVGDAMKNPIPKLTAIGRRIMAANRDTAVE